MNPERVIAHYRITARIGEGGMGEVYRATDSKLGRDVALKILPDAFARDADRMARFEREARVLAALNHPNIAAIYGVEEHVLVMELVEGPTLAERISEGPIPFEEALSIARQIAEALEYAHERGIIHRDLKPANVKITGPSSGNPDRVKVLDFGLAKALVSNPVSGNPASSPTLTMRATMAGMIMGTAAYMPPEQAKGNAVDQRADIWSFGVLLMEILTGQTIYRGESVSETLASVIRDQPDFGTLPGGTPSGVRKLLRRCLEKDPRRRLQAIGEARIAIDDAIAGAPAEEPVSRRPVLPWALALVAISLALISIIFHPWEAPLRARVIRFTVSPPDKTDFAEPSPAISPDGSRLAFTTWSDGRSALWVRPLDSVPPQQLPGTEGASQPFWSPDSRFLGFFADHKLKKVDLLGGPPQTLCEISATPRGGTWSRDGWILFGPGRQPIYRVSAAGGVPTPVTALDPPEQSHGSPYFLPDGRHFLYHRQMTTDVGVYLGVMEATSGEGKAMKQANRLIRTPVGAVYASSSTGPTGYLLYMREAMLVAQPFDADRLATAGDPHPIAELGVPTDISLTRAAFSASADGVLAYRNNGSVGSSQLVWFDRAGKDLGPAASVDYLSHPFLSPDGTHVAWNRPDPRLANWDIWMTDIARDVTSRFTTDPSVNDFPVWSSDGKYIFFESNRGGTEGIFRKLSSGAARDEPLFQSPNWKSLTSEAGSRFLLYSEQDPKTKWDIWVLPLEGDRKPKPLLQTPFNELHGQFSPDGKSFAYASDETGRYEVYVQRFPPSEARWQVSTTGGAQPRWRRDGKELFYLSGEGKLMVVEINSGAVFGQGRPKPLFQTRGPNTANIGFTYDVTGDGQRFLVNTRAVGNANASPIYVVVNWTAELK